MIESQKVSFSLYSCSLIKISGPGKYPLNRWIDEQTGFPRPTGMGTIDSVVASLRATMYIVKPVNGTKEPGEGHREVEIQTGGSFVVCPEE